KAGGYLCLKASQEIPDLLGCVVIAMPLESFKEVALDDSAVKEIKAALIRNKIGPFDDVYMATITGILREHMEKVLNSKEEASFFMGVKVPRKGYRDYIVRAPYKAVLSSNKPLLMIIGRKDEEFDPQITENLRKSLAEIKKENVKMATIMNLDGYMGMGIEPGCTWNYKINSDAFKLILNWLIGVNQTAEAAQKKADTKAEAAVAAEKPGTLTAGTETAASGTGTGNL
ncbi:MAG: hypothetical protein WBC00_04915, partial [Candidatus Omnitrophota bacterium]